MDALCVFTLANVLKINSTLQKMSLKNNRIKDRDVIWLVNKLQLNCSVNLNRIDFDQNFKRKARKAGYVL